MSDVIIYGLPPSSYTWTARIACEEKGISHELLPVEFGSDANKALHPFAKIPILKHGDVLIYETSAICRYLDEAFTGPSLQPSDAAGRARMEQWNSCIVDYAYDWAVRRIVIERLVVPQRGEKSDEAKIKDAVPHAKYVLGVMDKALTGSPYLAGGQPSIADWLLLPIVSYMPMVPEGKEITTGLGALTDWTKRMQARPSFAKTVPFPQ